MEADETEPWARDKRGQTLHEFQGRHHDMGGAVVVGAFELQHDIAGTVACQAFRPQELTAIRSCIWLSLAMAGRVM
jgi:hypothetical protein